MSDETGLTATERTLRKRARNRVLVLAIAVLAIVGAPIVLAMRSNIPVDYAGNEDHFKYGSIGSDLEGLPYWIWRALPEVFPDKLPGGYAGLGLIQESGMDRPIGFSKRRTGLFDRVAPNCALCHTAAIRDTATGPVRAYPASTS